MALGRAVNSDLCRSPSQKRRFPKISTPSLRLLPLLLPGGLRQSFVTCPLLVVRPPQPPQPRESSHTLPR
eukprot:768407-Hanusia_phi.AAC.2